ncbi:hypothetical protein B0H16DRAFT_1505243 [Mycena metata]|uniref:F-box domain-containing protein n=1 Tax=Mycena metata TaxID=1033252 RepID=A0AAD7K3A8_9AGAR|nr:hypothetical protein B0H16DRAFT_1505243 [Mycena metata]
MVFSPILSSQLVWLPAELLLIIVDFLCETRVTGPSKGRRRPKTISSSTSTLHVRSLSVVCRRLRQLCLGRLFSRMRISHFKQLHLFMAKCTVDVGFASLTRELDLAHVISQDGEDAQLVARYGCDILPALLPCLQSLEWLDLDETQIDANLLAIVNSHPTLVTLGIYDEHLYALRRLSSSTSLSLSKIRVYETRLDCVYTRDCLELDTLMRRGPRIPSLSVQEGGNSQHGTLSLPGLEKLDVQIASQHAASISWLPAFAGRHTSLHLIKFSALKLSALNWTWSRTPDVKFPLQFIREVERESLASAVHLKAFSISRTKSASSLDDWCVVALELKIIKAAGISGLRIASSIVPHISSLILGIFRFAKPIHADNVVSSLSLFPCLRQLELHSLHRHLLYEGHAPWILPSPDTSPVGNISGCINAHSAILWIVACVARTTRLEFFHFTDEGFDLEVSEHEKRFSHPWSVKATYEIQRNNDLEFHGVPKLHVANRYRRSAVAASRPIIYGQELRPLISPVA